MLPDARWWYSRLRAMSLAEVAHRGARLARYPIDVAATRAGLYGPSRALRERLAYWRPAAFVFSEATARAPLAPALRAAAEAYLAGRSVVLGLGEVALPAEPWHHEPSVGGTWPLVDAARVVAAAPAGFDPRTTWELNRGHGWVVLARAWAATRERRFRDRLVSELHDWRRSNPIGLGINWVSAMEAAIRCHALAWIAALLREDDDAPWPLLAELLHAHGAFVARNLSRFSSANNHLIVELSGLAVVGRVLDLPRWREAALVELAREAQRQTLLDGVNVEMATHYHMFVLEALLLVAWLERAHGRRLYVIEAVIARMAGYLDAITLRSGAVLEQGDNDDGAIVPLLAPGYAAQLLSAANALAGGAPAASGEGARLLCDGAPAARVARGGSRRFTDAGQVVLRSARLHATFDAGPFGFGTLAAHAHCDALAVSVAFDDQPLLVERGTYRYDGAARDRYRATAAHNTVQIGAREQADATGPFLWARKPVSAIEHCALGEHDVVRASHDGFAPVRHTRSLLRLGDTLAVIDELDAIAEPAVARWHFAPDATLVELAGGWAIIRDGGGADRWLWLDDHPVRTVTTEHSPRYLAQQPACTLEVELVHGRLVTVIGADAHDRVAALHRIREALGSAA